MLAKLSVDKAFMKAKSHLKKKEVIEAKKLYRLILQTYPKNLRAQQELAALNNSKQNNTSKSAPQETIDQLVNLYNQGQFSTVVEQAQGLTKQYPNTLIIWNILGASTAQIGELDDAIDAYTKLIALKPDYYEAYNNMGLTFKNQGKLEQAIEAYNKSIAIKPDYANAYSNMGVALKVQGKLDEAIEALKKSISLKPDYPVAYYHMGSIFQYQGKLDEAIEAYNNSIALKLDYSEAYFNLGSIFHDQSKLDKAIEAYKKSISIKPDFAIAYSNMGLTFHDQGKLDKAIEAFKKSISLKPDYYEAYVNLSLTLLNSGKLKDALEKYEWRWKTDEFLSQYRHFSQPLWNKKIPLKGKTILIWSEQGVGDTITWSSCISYVASQAKRCILECQEKLVPLLKRSFPKIEVRAADKSFDTKRNDFDFHIPMGSLYKNLNTEIFYKTKVDAYLTPDPDRVNYWKKRLNSLGKGPYIGISWKSNNMDKKRLPNYATISELYPVLKLPNITYINLQYTDFANDLTNIKKELGVTIHNFDDLDHFNNIDDVAALYAALDMVISIKSTIPLISAGVGTSTKLANWKQSAWNNILLNPRGPLVQIYERNTWETWDNVFSSIAEDISKIIKNWSF